MITEPVPEYNELLAIVSILTAINDSVPKSINLVSQLIFKVVIKSTLKVGIKLIPKYTGSGFKNYHPHTTH